MCTFRKLRHINLQEISAVLRLATDLVKQRKAIRFVALVDSIVTRGAISKGRSSSRAIASLLRRLCSTMIAGSLYATLPFCPTRHNPSDDPTRDKEVRIPGSSLDLASWDDDDVIALASLPRLKRWAANWVRVVLLAMGPSVLHLHDRAVFRAGLAPPSVVAGCHMDFDSTLGFAGDGPCRLLPWCYHPFKRLLLSVAVLSLSPDFRSTFWGEAMPIVPRSGADVRRAGLRRA